MKAAKKSCMKSQPRPPKAKVHSRNETTDTKPIRLISEDSATEREATRLIFKKGWLSYDVWVTFTYEGITYRYSHDELLQTFITELGIIKNTKSWKQNGLYHFPRLSKK